jgi:hypothetical protein
MLSSKKTNCATETEGLGRLITSISTAAKFLRTRLVDLERTAFDIHAVEFSNALAASSSGPSSTNP